MERMRNAYACKGAYTHRQLMSSSAVYGTPSSPVREREREKERKKERKRERENLFIKGMTGALAPFSYLI
jgi:hypothetical protein